MNQYAVIHITKYKELGGISAHIDRTHIPENANPNKVGFNENISEELDLKLIDLLGDTVDKTKTQLNHAHNPKPELFLSKAIWKRIHEGHTITNQHGKIETIRHDAVLALGVILSGSHERMMRVQADPQLFETWKKANYDFACQVFRKENIVRFSLHLDEKTPHIHCVVVPIDGKGRLSARSFINGAKQLRHIQDLYAHTMAPFGLSRGISKELTHRVHLQGPNYNQAVNLEFEKTAQITAHIKKSNVLKLDKVREEVTEHAKKLQVIAIDQAMKTQHALTTTNTLMDKAQARAYQQNLKESSRQAYEWIKKEIPLAPFLTNELGWSIDKQKSTKKDLVLKNPSNGNKIIVPTRPNPKTGHWIYSNVNGGGGTLIDLLVDANWSWDQIKSLADGKFIPQLDSVPSMAIPKEVMPAAQDPILQEKKARTYFESIVPSHGASFLDHRNILRSNYEDLKGLKVSTQAAVFGLYKDVDQEGNVSLCSTITYTKDHHGNHTKRFQKDLPRGLSVLTDENGIAGAKKMVITESPVDALSYRQLSMQGIVGWKTMQVGDPVEASYNAQESVAFISTCGNLNFQTKKDFQALFELASAKDQMVVIAMDSDLEGRKMAETLIHLAEEIGCKYQYEIPSIEKDWNDILMNLEKFEERELNKELAQKQWAEFEETPFDDSLLKYLNIEQDTYLAFHNSIKTNAEAVLVALREAKQEEAEITATWSLKKQTEDYTGPASTAPFVSILKGEVLQADQMVLVASPLDALIHYQNQDHKSGSICYVYAATQSKKKLAGPLIGLLEQREFNKVVVANSPENEHLTKTIEEILQKQKLAYISTSVEINKPAHEHGIDLKQWKYFGENPYENSLLRNLGIEQETYLAFQDRIKTNESLVLVALEEGENKKEAPSTWSLAWDAQRGLKEQIEQGPILSILKGDLSQAEKVIITTSPLDALIHYQSQENKQDVMCYVYADVRSKEALKKPLKELKKKIEANNMDVAIVRYGQENEYVTRRIQNLFKEDTLKAYTNKLKKEIPLVPFLTNELGWNIDETKSTQQDITLVHPTNGEKITVSTSSKSSTGYWTYCNADGEKGTLIDLLVEEKWSWRQIIALAEIKFLPKVEVIADDKITTAYSILNTRAIVKETYEDLEGLQVTTKTAVFELYKDFNQEGNASLCSTVTYFKDQEGSNSKYFEKGLPRGLSVLQEKNQSLQQADTMVITESPIDVLSYHQLKDQKTPKSDLSYSPGKTVLISTCGSLTTQIKKDLEQIFELARSNNQTVVIAFNKDLAGQSMAKSLSDMLKKEGITYKVESPTPSRTWNEMLVNQENRQNLENQQHIAHKQWKEFTENDYQHSLLHHLGIEKYSYEAFQDKIKTNEKAVLISLVKDKNTENVLSTWNLDCDKEKEYKVYIEAGPALSILKGNLEQAEKVVLTTSPLDALLHYQEIVQTIQLFQANLGHKNQDQASKIFVQEGNKTSSEPTQVENQTLISQQELNKRLAELDHTCYVYTDPKMKWQLKDSLNRLLHKVNDGEKNLIIAFSKGNNRLAGILEQLLDQKEQKYEYSKITVNTPQINQTFTSNLEQGISLIGSLVSNNRNTDDEDYEEEDEKKKYMGRSI